MKSLNPNERKLLTFFLAACGLVACLFGARALIGLNAKTQEQLAEVRADIAANQVWLDERAVWEARERWMMEHPAPVPVASSQVAASELLSELQTSLAERGVQILEQGFSPSGRAGRFETITVRLKAQGPFAVLAKWLFETQKPEAYFGIKKISMKSDGAPPQVICEMEITQYLQSE